MLLVQPPDRARLMSVLEGFLEGKYSREEIVTWRDGIVAEFGDIDLSTGDGYWYFESLAALNVPLALGAEQDFFIRRRDVDEYLLDLQRVDSDQTYEGITRVREHQTDRDALKWPLLMFEHRDIKRLDQLGLKPVRGIFDPHRDLVEHVHLFFEGTLYLLVRQYDDRAEQVMVLGTDKNEDRLRRFLTILDFF